MWSIGLLYFLRKNNERTGVGSTWCEKQRFTLTYSNFIGEKVDLTKFSLNYLRVKFRNFHTWINNARFKFDPDATTIPQIRMKSLHGSKLNKSSCLDLGPCIHHVTCNFPPKLPIMKIISIKNYLLCFILVINSFKMSKIPISNLSLSIFWKKRQLFTYKFSFKIWD